MFLKRKVGVTERPRLLNPNKAIAMAICPIIVHFSTWRARSMHDVACEFKHVSVRSKDAQKQLARTSLNELSVRLARLSENESRLGTRDHVLENLSPGSTRSDLKVNMAKSGELNKLNSRKIDSRSCIFSLEN